MTRAQSRAKLTTALGIIVMLFGAMLAFAPGSGATVAPSLPEGTVILDGSGNVTICHRTSSNTNPYIVESPSYSSQGFTGSANHASHQGPVWDATLKDSHTKWGDIIPPISIDDGATVYYEGLNWTPEGQAIYEQGCGGEPEVATTLTLTKVVDGPAAPSEWSFAFSGLVNDVTLTDQTPTSESILVDPDTEYVISETDAQGAAQTSISCTGAESASQTDDLELTVTLASGDDAECTFTNTFRPELTVVKKVVNPPATWDFDFTLCGQEQEQPAFAAVRSLELQSCDFTLGNHDELTTSKSFDIGYAQVTELDDAHLTGIECLDADQEKVGNIDLKSSTASVELGSSDVTCTFTNTFPTPPPPPPPVPVPEPASLTITKAAVAAEGATVPDDWAFDFEGLPFGEFELTSSDPSIDSGDLDPGTYTVTEGALNDTELTSIDCGAADATVDLASQAVTVTVAAGEDVTCTFTNEFQPVEVLSEEETPTTTTTTEPPPVVEDSTVVRTLPRTGDENGRLATIGLCLLAAGFVLTMGSRRRLRALD